MKTLRIVRNDAPTVSASAPKAPTVTLYCYEPLEGGGYCGKSGAHVDCDRGYPVCRSHAGRCVDDGRDGGPSPDPDPDGGPHPKPPYLVLLPPLEEVDMRRGVVEIVGKRLEREHLKKVVGGRE